MNKDARASFDFLSLCGTTSHARTAYPLDPFPAAAKEKQSENKLKRGQP